MVKDGGLTRITNNEIENFRPNVSNRLAVCDVALLTLKSYSPNEYIFLE